MPEEYITGAGRRQRGIRLCGLEVDEIRKFVSNLLAISHAVDEKDWDRLKEEKYVKALDEVNKLADTMTKAGCVCPPHTLSHPRQEVRLLKENIEMKHVDLATQAIKNLLFGLAGDI